MLTTLDTFIGTLFGVLIRTILDWFAEKLTGKDIANYIRENVQKKPSYKLEAEINGILQKILRDPDCSLKACKAEVEFLYSPEKFFGYKKRMVDSLSQEDEYILIVGRPFFHLLPEEREQLSQTLSPASKAYLDTLNVHLDSGIGHFIYLIDPYDTVAKMLSKLHYSTADVTKANELLLHEVKQRSPRLKMYAAPAQAFGLDCILVNNANIQHEIVFGNRPLGSKTFEIGVRIKSKVLYERLRAFVKAAILNSEREQEKGFDLKYFLDDALKRVMFLDN